MHAPGSPVRVVQVLTQQHGGPVDHAVDVAVGLAGRGLDSHVVGPACAGTERAERAGVTWHRLTATSKRDLLGLLRVAGRLRRLRPDVLHLHDRRAGWLGRFLGPCLRGTRVVYTLHGVPDSLSHLVRGNLRVAPQARLDRLRHLHAERWLTRWGRADVVSPSAAVAAYAVEHVGLAREQVHVVPNGVDPERFTPRARGGTPAPGRLVVAWVGSLEPVKGLDLLVDALARAEGVQLLLAGDGPGRAHLVDRLVSDGLTTRVELVGRVLHPEEVLARADALLVTSLAESCPMVVLQALATGLPVVATAVGGVPEVLRDGQEGLLVAPGDAAGLAGALGLLRDDADRRVAMAAAARERVLAAYTLEHCLDRLETVYAGAVSCAC